MKTEVKRWGNSLGLRIPKDITRQLGLHDGSSIELEVVENGVLIKPMHKTAAYTIQDLLKGVNRESIHQLEETEPVGQEVW